MFGRTLNSLRDLTPDTLLGQPTLRVERAPNTRFFDQIFLKCAYNAFLACFFKSWPAVFLRVITIIWESSKNHFGRPKQKEFCLIYIENAPRNKF